MFPYDEDVGFQNIKNKIYIFFLFFSDMLYRFVQPQDESETKKVALICTFFEYTYSSCLH